MRQLAPGATGLPLQVYCFTKTVVWEEYEDAQSDIFDHLLAILPELGLRLYQAPAGADVSTAIGALGEVGGRRHVALAGALRQVEASEAQ